MVEKKHQSKTLSTQLAIMRKQIIADAKKNIDIPPPTQRFNPPTLLEQKAELEAEAGLESLQQVINTGLQSIFEALQELEKEAQIQEIMNWFQANEQKVVDVLKNDELFSGKEADSSVEAKLGLPKEFLEEMYQATLFHFEKEQYEKALSSVLLCLFINGTLYELWLTYGNILQRKEDYEGALYGYQIASIFSSDDPQLYIYMTISWVSLQNLEKAESSLAEAFEICKNNEEYAELDHYCHELKVWLDNQKSSAHRSTA